MKFGVTKKSLLLVSALVVTGYGREGLSSNRNKSTRKPPEFRIVIMGEFNDTEATEAGFRSDGFSFAHLGFTDYEGSNGEKLRTEDGEFRSPEEARRYFDWKIARSSKILTRGIKKDPKGKSVGYRAEVLLAPDQKQLAVMWTDGKMFFQITANSLADAEELEKR